MTLVGASAGTSSSDELKSWREADAATRTAVLSLARKAFDAYVLRREVIEPPKGLPAILTERAAVFVSSMRNGAPRCCMGSLYPAEAIAAEEIIANAVAAAGRDRRFPPIKPAEAKELTLIVSLVSRPRSISASELDSLNPERDGLVARRGDRFGVVLSGETAQRDRMIRWAGIRAGAKAGDSLEYFRIDCVRFIEPSRP